MVGLLKNFKFILFVLAVIAIIVFGVRSKSRSVSKSVKPDKKEPLKQKKVTFADEQPDSKYDLYSEIESFLTRQSEYLSN